MRFVRLATIVALASLSAAHAQQTFTLQQVLSAPYALQLTAAPVGNHFAWIENAEGRRNIWIGSPTEPARQLTHYTEDDAQDINQIAWSPDGTAIAYTYGAEDGADGHPANPAHLQRSTANVIIVQPLAPNATAVTLGEGHNPLFTPDGGSILFIRNGQIWGTWNPIPREYKPCPPSATICELPESDRHLSGPIQLVFDRGRASSLTLSPDGHLLAFISHRPTTDGPAHSFLALFNLTTHELTFPAASTSEDSAPTFSPDGHQLAWLRAPYTHDPEYTPHLTSPNPWSIQLLDLATNTTSTVYSPEPNKPGSMLPHIVDSAPYLLWVRNDPMGRIVQSRPQNPVRPRSMLQQVHFSQHDSQTLPLAPDGRTPWIAFFAESDGFTHLYAVDPSRPNATADDYQMQGSFEVEDAKVLADRNLIYFASNSPLQNEPDIDREHIWAEIASPYFGGVGPVQITRGDGIETHPTPSGDGKWIGYLASSINVPLHIEFIETQEIWAPGGRLQPKNPRVINAHPSVNPTTYPASQLVTPKQALIPSTDNFTIHAQLFLPPHLDPTKKHATILFVHGGPNRQMLLGYPPMDYYSNAYAMNQYLTSLGFIVLSVNYRGGTGYGLAFREAAHYGPDGASEYNDVLAAQKYLAARPDVDAKRIGIWGGSYGGYLTALALARNSDLFAAGVDFHGVHEWSLEGSAESWMPDPGHSTAAQRDAMAALAHASSPMADIDHWRSPVLLIHGDNDPEVNFAQTPILANALRARHVPVEELIFPDEVHGFLLHKDWLAAYTAAAEFFVRTLKP